MTKILFERELAELMQVPTTVKQAKQIIERNTAALDVLQMEKNTTKTIDIACPHCKQACQKCAYPYNINSCYQDQCLRYRFGGFNYYDICNFIRLAQTSITVYGIEPNPSRTRVRDRENAQIWLQGHIEWAEAVIKKKKKKAKRGS